MVMWQWFGGRRRRSVLPGGDQAIRMPLATQVAASLKQRILVLSNQCLVQHAPLVHLVKRKKGCRARFDLFFSLSFCADLIFVCLPDVLLRKVAEESDAVDPALVPRKLRSGMN